MSEVVEYPIDDPEYMMPKDAAKLREDKLETTTMSAPAATYVTVLRMEAEFMPLDVLIHRALNNTQGRESEA